MNLVASLIVRNEIGRWLMPCIDHLLDFCDEIRVLDDGSTDGTGLWLLTGHPESGRRVKTKVSPEPSFYAHEGRARQALLDWTMEAEPTHVLALDADELVADGAAVRAAAEEDGCPTWTLDMQEVWGATESVLLIREDGGWRSHGVPMLYRAPTERELRRDPDWRMADVALAGGRVPVAVSAFARRQCTQPCGADVLHFGWANEAAREGRFQRYVEHDGGRFHNIRHLESIMWDDTRVTLRSRLWPDALLPFHMEILTRVLPTSVG